LKAKFQALVELSVGFSISEAVNTVCLAENEPSRDQLCLTAGWQNVGANGKSNNLAYFACQRYLTEI